MFLKLLILNKTYFACNLRNSRFVLSVQTHDEGHWRVQKMVQTSGQNWNVDMLPGEGKKERSNALGNCHEFLKIRTFQKHLIFEQDTSEKLYQTLDPEPCKDVF